MWRHRTRSSYVHALVYMASRHYMNKCWLNVNWAIRKFELKYIVFIEKYVLKKLSALCLCRNATLLGRLTCNADTIIHAYGQYAAPPWYEPSYRILEKTLAAARVWPYDINNP